MPKASEVANALRELADHLERGAETEVVRPLVFFYPDNKDQLATISRLLPRPLNKFTEGDGEFDKIGVDVRKGDAEPIWIRASISRYSSCERIQVGTKLEPEHVIPAREETIVPEQEVPVYAWHCPPILTEA